MRIVTALFVLVAACSSAPAREVSPPTTTTTTFAAVLLDHPRDPEGARCQAIVNALVAEWQPLSRVEAGVRCLPHVDGESGHYNLGSRYAVVRFRAGMSDAFYRSVAAHELGHAWDYFRLESPDQRRYGEIRGAGWDPEDYADVFAIALGHPTVFPSRSALLGPVTPELIETLRTEGLLPR